ncbi:hypothetical protein COLO4_12074 [Corchorus olitorius]|uniref:Uncharacterized protein n=1 Tax=Corchorus olitorius TaxID=93759 RepID=A0A1R3K267_9ROSI|nr:hypothetical protein COLO4_12074 [Corchorus olitorius]
MPSPSPSIHAWLMSDDLQHADVFRLRNYDKVEIKRHFNDSRVISAFLFDFSFSP